MINTTLRSEKINWMLRNFQFGEGIVPVKNVPMTKMVLSEDGINKGMREKNVYIYIHRLSSIPAWGTLDGRNE